MNWKPNLGKHLAVGETFETTTNRMAKSRQRLSTYDHNKHEKLRTYEVLRPGEQRFFQKGKRRYFCQVLQLVEIRTGFNCFPIGGTSLYHAPRWWQFTYLVRILEN